MCVGRIVRKEENAEVCGCVGISVVGVGSPD